MEQKIQKHYFIFLTYFRRFRFWVQVWFQNEYNLDPAAALGPGCISILTKLALPIFGCNFWVQGRILCNAYLDPPFHGGDAIENGDFHSVK